MSENLDGATEAGLRDISITCIDCRHDFVWTTGEQTFFHDKGLSHPPKRCKHCKKAKNRRLAAVEKARTNGHAPAITISTFCASCSQKTTIPFYPSQGRPVYCRPCFVKANSIAARG